MRQQPWRAITIAAYKGPQGMEEREGKVEQGKGREGKRRLGKGRRGKETHPYFILSGGRDGQLIKLIVIN